MAELHVSACCPDHICHWTDQRSQIYLNKLTFYRRLTFTFTPKQHLKKFLKQPPLRGCIPFTIAQCSMLPPPNDASTPPIPRAPPCRVKPPQLHLKVWTARMGSTGPPATLQPPAKGANGMGQLGTSHPTEIHLPRTTGRGNLLSKKKSQVASSDLLQFRL